MATLERAAELFLERRIEQSVRRDKIPGLIGGLSKSEKRELVTVMAGTGDTRSKAYKSAQRQINLYAQGKRSPSTAGYLNRIKSYFATSNKEKKKSIGNVRLKVEITGVIKISGDKRRRTITSEMDGGYSRDFLEQLIEGERENALEAFFDAYGAPYGSVSDESVIIREI